MAEVVRRLEGPNIRYFVAILRFVAIYTLFGRLWTLLFLVKNKKQGYCAWMADGGYIHYPYHIWERSEDMEDQNQNWKKGSGGWYWQIFSDDTLRSARQKQIRRCSTFFAKQLCNQSCLEHSSAEPGALCAFFLQHQFVLAFILLFCLSKLWHAKAVSCQLDRTSEVNAFAYFQPVCLSQSAFFDVSFWKYSTIPHVISSQWFQSAHSPNYFHPHNQITIPVSAFPSPCCCIIWNTLYQHNHAPNTNIINGL